MADLWTQLAQTDRTSRLGVINTELTVKTREVAQEKAKLVAVFVAYDVAMSGNVVVTLESGAGDTFDVTLATIALVSQRYGVYRPDGGPLDLAEGDIVKVVAAAGGATSTAAVMVYMDRVPLLSEGAIEA